LASLYLFEPFLAAFLEPDLEPSGAPDAASADAIRRAGQIATAVVAAAFTIPIGELRATSRRPAPVAFARQSAMYLAHVAFGLTYADVGRAFGRDRTTAAHACRIVEDRRVEPGLDAQLASLEHLLRRTHACEGAAA
jgi:chromosomal replication initiation ATPase DnaA